MSKKLINIFIILLLLVITAFSLYSQSQEENIISGEDQTVTESNISITGYGWQVKRVIDSYAINHNITTYSGSIQIQNLGTDTVKVSSLTIIDDPDSIFKIDTTKIPNLLKPGEKATIDVFFTPKDEESYNSNIILEVKSGTKSTVVYSTLKGQGALPYIKVSDLQYDKEVTIGNSSVKNIVIKNITNKYPYILTVTGFTIQGPDSAEFSISKEFMLLHPFPIILNVNDSLSVPTTFTPTHIGSSQAIFSVKSDASDMHNISDNVGDILATAKEPSDAADDNYDGIEANIRLYPNPFSDKLNIELINENPGKVEIVVRNMLGEIVSTISNTDIGSGVFKFEWQPGKSVSGGTYYLEINENGKIIRRNLVYLP